MNMTQEYMTAKKFQSSSYNPLPARDAKDIEPAELMPIKARPYAHQIVGYNMACRILLITKGGD
jgi:hypothetical protein